MSILFPFVPLSKAQRTCSLLGTRAVRAIDKCFRVSSIYKEIITVKLSLMTNLINFSWYFIAQARIAFLQGERKGQENLKNDLVRRIKMLEYALKQER